MLKSRLLLNKKVKLLSTKFIWNSGTAKTGRIVVHSKGKKIYTSATNLLTHRFLDNSLHFLYSISFFRSVKTPYALFFSSSGKCSYSSINNFNTHFRIFKTKGNFDNFSMENSLLVHNLNFSQFPILHYSIFRVAFMSLIRNLQVKPGDYIKFSRSLGSCSTLLRKNLELLSVIVKLPSGVKKIFSLFSLCQISTKSVDCATQFKVSSKRENYLKKLAPRSRGVAKNPIDHPHGGRTKSIKYPRTP
jgi:hypothetical protein